MAKSILTTDINLQDYFIVVVTLNEGVSSITVNGTEYTKSCKFKVRRTYGTINWQAKAKFGYTLVTSSGNSSSNSGVYHISPTCTKLDVVEAVLWDRTQNKHVIIDPYDLEKYDKERYAPMGVMVIPFNHDVYGTGEGAMMSLNYMRYDDPDNGGDYQYMYWGNNKESILPDNYRTTCPYINGSDISNPNPSIVGTYGSKIYFPTDRYTRYPSGTDPLSAYDSNSTTGKYGISPYLANGKINPLYYSIEAPSSPKSCLATFNGKEITQYIWENKVPTNLKDPEVIVSENSTDFLPFFCCHKYKTEGTNLGDWFLPSAGEIIYM